MGFRQERNNSIYIFREHAVILFKVLQGITREHKHDKTIYLGIMGTKDKLF